MNVTTLFDRRTRGDGSGGGAPARARVRIRTVALPVEHGGWSLTLEPVALGLLVAPSPAGFLLALAVACAFLARHPFKIVAADRVGGVALASGLAEVAVAPGYSFLLLLLAALPFASTQLAFDAAGRGRALLPELVGSFGLAAVASAIATAGGWPLVPSLGLWALLAARALPSILYVRARLDRLHGETPSALPAVAAHVAALALVSLLAWAKVAPPVAAAVFFILLLRAAAGLYARKPGGSAKRVGVSEVCYGVMTVAAVAAGYLLRP